MKALSSFSSPSSSNGKQTTAGCIARLLGRILCLRSLSTCPFDYLKEEDEERLLDVSTSAEGTIPGVVARLMGLDSLPIRRRRPSTDSGRSFKKLKPPRVRRQWVIPITYKEAEDDEFFIFSFEGRRSRKRTSTDSCSGKTEPQISCESDEKSENSSPGSVGFPTHHQQASSSSSSSSSSGDVSRLRNSRMRRTLSDELGRCDTRGALMIFPDNGFVGKQKLKRHWDEVGREVMKLSWVEDEIYRNQNYLKEIGRDVSSLILGQLLDELCIST